MEKLEKRKEKNVLLFLSLFNSLTAKTSQQSITSPRPLANLISCIQHLSTCVKLATQLRLSGAKFTRDPLIHKCNFTLSSTETTRDPLPFDLWCVVIFQILFQIN